MRRQRRSRTRLAAAAGRLLSVVAISALAGAGPARKAKPVRHATRREIQRLLDHRVGLTPARAYYLAWPPDLPSFPARAERILAGRSARRGIAEVVRETGLGRQDATDLLLMALLPDYDEIDTPAELVYQGRRRALLEGVVRHAPKSVVAADVLGRCIAHGVCVWKKEKAQIAALRSLPRPIAEYWIGFVYDQAQDYEAAATHYGAAVDGYPFENRVRFDHARAACQAGEYSVCLAGIEATKRDRRLMPSDVRDGLELYARRSYWRGQALAGLGRDDEARAAFEASVPQPDPRLTPGWPHLPGHPRVPRHQKGAVDVLLCDVGNTYAHQKRWKAAQDLLLRGDCAGDLAEMQFGRGEYFDAILNWEMDRSGNVGADQARAYAALGSMRVARGMTRLLVELCADPEARAGYDCKDIASFAARLATAEMAEPAPSSALLARLRAPRLAAWRELPLPTGATPIPTRRAPKPFELNAVLTASTGNRVLVVTEGDAFDGRVGSGPGGYWVRVSTDAGKHFGKPLFLGFTAGFPYYVVDKPCITPFSGTSIRIEVQRRKADAKTAWSPAEDSRPDAKPDDVYLDIPFAKLERDSDGDGLTDLFEDRLGTDPRSKDTDGDGLDDAVDPEPLTPRATRSDDEDEILAAGLGNVLFGRRLVRYGGARSHASKGHGALPLRTLFVVSDRPLFASRVLPERTIVLSGAEAAAYRRKFGYTKMLDLPIVFDRQKRRALVDYHLWGEGGSVLATRTKKGWSVEQFDSWIR